MSRNRNIASLALISPLFIFQFALAAPNTHIVALYDAAIYRKAVQQIAETAPSRNISNISVISNITESLDPNWDGGSKGTTDFDLVDNFSKLVQSQLKSGELNKDDQLFLQVLAHGGGRQPGEDSHSIQVGGKAVSLDKLKPILAELKKAGVKVAIFDGSCYSGATDALKSENVCVLSSSTMELPASEDSRKNGTFLDFFWSDLKTKDPKKRISLEEAFLSARKKRNSMDQLYTWQNDRPQISSSPAAEILNPVMKAADATRFAKIKDMDCSVENLKNQIATLRSTSSDTFKFYNPIFVAKLTRLGDLMAEEARIDALIMQAEDSNQNEKAQELASANRKNEKEKNRLQDEVYKLESELYQKYHDDLRAKNSQKDPCGSFML